MTTTKELIHSECLMADQQSYANELYALLSTHEGMAELASRFNDAGLRLKGDGTVRDKVSFNGTGYRASKRSSGTIMIEGLLELQARQDLQATLAYVEHQAALLVSPAYATEIIYRLKMGHSFFYYHQECGNPRHRYDDVLRADCAQETICSGCQGNIHETPKAAV